MSTSSMMTESSVEQLKVPFPSQIVRVFVELERIEAESKKPNARNQPSHETVEWAMEVLLRVVPSTFLLGSEINAFQSEIHVSWENLETGKTVVAFLQHPDMLKFYYERTVNGEAVEHNLVSTDNVGDLSARLEWFFGPVQ